MAETIASDKYYVIIGLGLSGMSVVRFFLRENIRFYVMDSREQPPGLEELKEKYPNVRVSVGSFDKSILASAAALVLSPGVPRDEPTIAELIKAGKRITSDVELFLDESPGKTVGVTGSNGKSTVVTILGEIAIQAGIKAAVGGNIGTPVLDLLEKDYELFILELSSFQLENIAVPKLDIACILNVSPDHLDRHKNIQAYFQAKQRIYFSAKTVVYNLEDQLTIPPVVAGVERSGFALSKPVEEWENQFWFDSGVKILKSTVKDLMSYNDMRIKGLHNVANALAVFAICNTLKVPESVSKKALQSFTGLAHRCQWVTTKNKVTFINDSKATNEGAAIAAIRGLESEFSECYLIAGGDGKGASFLELAKAIRENIDGLILIGRDAEKIATAVGGEVKIYRTLNMQAAVELANQLAGQGSLVLLSPACASFDMYGGYEERGREFIAAVEKVCG